MRTLSLVLLVFLFTTVANAAVVRGHSRANAQRSNDIPGNLPPRDGDAGLHPRLLSSFQSQRRTSEGSSRVPARDSRRLHRRRRAHV